MISLHIPRLRGAKIEEPGNIAQELQQNFNTVFASTNDLMQIGIHGSAGYSIIFDDPSYLTTFLPATGAPGVLTANLLDPATSAAGSYGGEVATMQLNIAFSDAGVLKGNLNLPFGNLVLTNLTGDLSFADGLTVRQVFADANTVLGVGPTPNPSVSFSDMFTLINNIDMALESPIWVTSALPNSQASAANSAPRRARPQYRRKQDHLGVCRRGRTNGHVVT
jgi:hypothetical protein